jgi:hypothetical protein
MFFIQKWHLASAMGNYYSLEYFSNPPTREASSEKLLHLPTMCKAGHTKPKRESVLTIRRKIRIASTLVLLRMQKRKCFVWKK